MSTMLTLSIVIPAHNEENHLKACLEAIKHQTVRPFEVIVVDNNSTDKTAEIAQSYKFVSLITETKQGIAYARNAGFSAARGDLIGRIDADTHLAPDWAEQTLTYMNQHTEIQAITGNCTFYDFPLPRFTRIVHSFFYYHLHALLAGGTILWGSNMVVRKTAWRLVRDHTHIQSNIHEDVDLSIVMHKHKLPIRRARSLVASVSLRRGGVNLRRDYKYLSAWPRTYAVNGLHVKAAMINVLKWFIIIFLALPTLLLSQIQALKKT